MSNFFVMNFFVTFVIFVIFVLITVTANYQSV